MSEPTTDDAERTPLAPYYPVRCPRCATAKPLTYGQRGRIRYHRCQDCRTRFRSLELRSAELHTWKEPRR